jgi:hypothetical protein
MHDYSKVLKEVKAQKLNAAVEYHTQIRDNMANVIEMFWDENFDREKSELTIDERAFIDWCETTHKDLRRTVVTSQAELASALAELNGLGNVTDEPNA